MTSPARISSVWGSVSFSVRAVLRLITSSNSVGYSTGCAGGKRPGGQEC
jgi:hypothetical protein